MFDDKKQNQSSTYISSVTYQDKRAHIYNNEDLPNTCSKIKENKNMFLP